MKSLLTGGWWHKSVGGVMVGAGIIMDGALGIKLLRGISWQGMLLHLLVTLVWANTYFYYLCRIKRIPSYPAIYA